MKGKYWKYLAQCQTHSVHSSVLITHHSLTCSPTEPYKYVSDQHSQNKRSPFTPLCLCMHCLFFLECCPPHVLCSIKPQLKWHLFHDSFLMPLETLNQFSPIISPPSTLFNSLLLDLVKHLFSDLSYYEEHSDRSCVIYFILKITSIVCF